MSELEVIPGGVQVPAMKVFQLDEQPHPPLGGQDGFHLRYELLVVLIVQLAAQPEADHLRRACFDCCDHDVCLLEKRLPNIILGRASRFADNLNGASGRTVYGAERAAKAFERYNMNRFEEERTAMNDVFENRVRAAAV